MTASSGAKRRAAAEVWVESRAEATRAALGALVVATEAFSGFLPGGGAAFTCPRGKRLQRADAVAVKHPEKFRALTSVEVERDVKSVVMRARSSVGL